MKCGACGYEKRHKEYNIKTPVYYKSGKRKGEIKEIIDEVIRPFEYDLEFIPIVLKQFSNTVEAYISNEYEYNYGDKSVDIYACPQCGTLRMEEF